MYRERDWAPSTPVGVLEESPSSWLWAGLTLAMIAICMSETADEDSLLPPLYDSEFQINK